MTIELGVDKNDLEKTIAVDKKIRLAADIVTILPLAAAVVNPLALIPTGVAVTVAYIADRQATRNQEKLNNINIK